MEYYHAGDPKNDLQKSTPDSQNRPYVSLSHQEISTLDGVGYECRAAAVLVFQRHGCPFSFVHITLDESGRLANPQLELISNQSFCCFRLDMTCSAKVNIWHPPCKRITGRHSVLFRVRWAYRDFSLRQAPDSEEVIIHRATSSKLLAGEFVNQPLQCISFPQIGDRYLFIFKEMGTPCQEHIICPFQSVLNRLINGENLSFFLRKKDSVSLDFERWGENSNIASWVDDS